jgi:hypothetical protein
MTRLVLLFVALGALTFAAPLPFPKTPKSADHDLKVLRRKWVLVKQLCPMRFSCHFRTPNRQRNSPGRMGAGTERPDCTVCP